MTALTCSKVNATSSNLQAFQVKDPKSAQKTWLTLTKWWLFGKCAHEWTRECGVLAYVSEMETESGQTRSQTALYILFYGISKLKMCLKTDVQLPDTNTVVYEHILPSSQCALTSGDSLPHGVVVDGLSLYFFVVGGWNFSEIVWDATLVTQHQLRRWNRTYFMEIMFFPLCALLHVSVINWVPWWTDSFAYC